MNEYNKMLFEMTEYMRYLFDQSITTTKMMFEHVDRLFDFAAGQGDESQDEMHKRFKEWLESSKKLRNEYIDLMQAHFKKIEEYYKEMK